MYFSKLLFYSSTIFGVACFNSEGKFSRPRFLYALVLTVWRFPFREIFNADLPDPEDREAILNAAGHIGHEAVIIAHVYKSYVCRDAFEHVYEVLSKNYSVAVTKAEIAIAVMFATSAAYSIFSRGMWSSARPAFSMASVAETLVVFQFCSISRSVTRGHGVLTLKLMNKQIYAHLTRLHVLKRANAAHGPQLFFEFLLLVGIVMILFYRYIINCWCRSEPCNFYYTSFIQVVILTKLFVSCLLIVCCEHAEAQVLGFYESLRKLMRQKPQLYSNKKLTLILSMDESIQFTACGFFKLGYPLVTSVIAAASTYAVVIYQLSQMADEE